MSAERKASTWSQENIVPALGILAVGLAIVTMGRGIDPAAVAIKTMSAA